MSDHEEREEDGRRERIEERADRGLPPRPSDNRAIMQRYAMDMTTKEEAEAAHDELKAQLEKQ